LVGLLGHEPGLALEDRGARVDLLGGYLPPRPGREVALLAGLDTEPGPPGHVAVRISPAALAPLVAAGEKHRREDDGRHHESLSHRLPPSLDCRRTGGATCTLRDRPGGRSARSTSSPTRGGSGAPPPAPPRAQRPRPPCRRRPFRACPSRRSRWCPVGRRPLAVSAGGAALARSSSPAR